MREACPDPVADALLGPARSVTVVGASPEAAVAAGAEPPSRERWLCTATRCSGVSFGPKRSLRSEYSTMKMNSQSRARNPILMMMRVRSAHGRSFDCASRR